MTIVYMYRDVQVHATKMDATKTVEVKVEVKVNATNTTAINDKANVHATNPETNDGAFSKADLEVYVAEWRAVNAPVYRDLMY